MSSLVQKCTPRQVREFVIDVISAGLVPFIHGSPGIGKSAVIASIGQEFGLEMIDHRLSTSTPEDMSGLPKFRDILNEKGEVEDTVATFVPFDIFPTVKTKIPTGKNGWVLFFDEANSAGKAVQAASYKTVLDKMVGQKKIHPNVAMIMAGNLATDKAIVNQLSTAMQSRVIHLEMTVDLKEFMEDVAIPRAWDHRVIAYLNHKKDALMDFKADHDDHTFCCPRTWDFLQRMVKGKQFALTRDADGNEVYEMERKTPLYAGTITSGTAIDFVQFTKVFHRLPKLHDILADPTGTPVPTDSATRWAITSQLIQDTDETNADPIFTYTSRFPAEFRLLFSRGMLNGKQHMRHHPAFARAMVEFQRYINNEDNKSSGARLAAA